MLAKRRGHRRKKHRTTYTEVSGREKKVWRLPRGTVGGASTRNGRLPSERRPFTPQAPRQAIRNHHSPMYNRITHEKSTRGKGNGPDAHELPRTIRHLSQRVRFHRSLDGSPESPGSTGSPTSNKMCHAKLTRGQTVTVAANSQPDACTQTYTAESRITNKAVRDATGCG